MADSFLGRWSQRKQAEREGKPLDEPVAKPLHVPSAAQDVGRGPEVAPPLVPTMDGQQAKPGGQASPPPPSLEDVTHLTPQSNFAPFVARDVAPEVRNAAMKKLFADPHYNVMDRLDIYIDDYSKPDPLPESMLRQMASAKFLHLFEEDEQDTPENRLRDDADTPTDHSVAQSAQAPGTGADHFTQNTSQLPGPDHDNTHLRLQPNHAAGPQKPGRGTE